MIAKGKSISHGTAALEYDLAKEIDGQAAATEIARHELYGCTGAEMVQEMKPYFADFPNVKNNCLRFEVSPSIEESASFTDADWAVLGNDFMQRMGAGTNCQQKLIALHHLDCPWRPSDLQQREGRIIRQGNENPEVDIYSYVTEGTFDAYLYQLVESKQKFISQIMTSKSPVRSAEDVDEQALSYAEIKALASGNPMIKEKMDLDIEVSKLKLLKANHLSQKYALEDAISKGFPKQIAETQARITGYGADIATVKGNTHPNADGFSPLTLAGVTYADKKEAGAALLTMCQTMLSPEATQIGSYRGLTLELSFDTFAREYRLTMIGQLRHTVTLGTDVFGNLQRMDNALEGLPIKEQACREQLSNLQTQLETAKAEVQKPFPREEELTTKTARLEELNTLLNLDHKEPEIVDAEPDEDQRPPERRRPQLER